MTSKEKVWSESSDKIIGRGNTEEAAWQNAAESLPAQPGQDRCEGGDPCWFNQETGYREYCPKHEAIIADKAMEADARRNAKPAESLLEAQIEGKTDVRMVRHVGGSVLGPEETDALPVSVADDRSEDNAAEVESLPVEAKEKCLHGWYRPECPSCNPNAEPKPTPSTPSEREQTEDLYYIQDKRSYCGNSCFWWKPDGNGYTCNLEEAWKVTREKAESIVRHRPDVDVAWPVAVIDAGAARHFDMQKLREMRPL